MKETEQQRIRLQENQKLLTKQQLETSESLQQYQEQLQQQFVEAGLDMTDLTAPALNLSVLEKEIATFDQELLVLRDRQERLKAVIKGRENLSWRSTAAVGGKRRRALPIPAAALWKGKSIASAA